MQRAGDAVAVIEDPPALKQPVPVVDVSADQGEGLGLGVAQVASRIHQALGEPDPHQPGFIELARSEEVEGAGHGKKELAQGTAQKMQRFAEEVEKDVPGLMEQEVDAVDKMVFVRECEPDDIGQNRDQEESFGEHASSSAERRRNL